MERGIGYNSRKRFWLGAGERVAGFCRAFQGKLEGIGCIVPEALRGDRKGCSGFLSRLSVEADEPIMWTSAGFWSGRKANSGHPSRLLVKAGALRILHGKGFTTGEAGA